MKQTERNPFHEMSLTELADACRALKQNVKERRPYTCDERAELVQQTISLIASGRTTSIGSPRELSPVLVVADGLESTVEYLLASPALPLDRTDVRIRAEYPRKSRSSLIERERDVVVARIDCRARATQHMCQRWAAVVGERPETWTISNGVWRDWGSAVDQIVRAAYGRGPTEEKIYPIVVGDDRALQSERRVVCVYLADT